MSESDAYEPPKATSQVMQEQSLARTPWWVKPLIVISIVGAFGFISRRYGDLLTIQSLAEREAQLIAFQQQSPGVVYGGAFLLYVIVSALSIPGGAVALSLAYGSFFGWSRAMLLVSFASTAGATLAFLTSRYLFRDFVQNKFAAQLVTFNQRLEEEGAFYLFSMRLIFAVPFSMLNLVMGLTQMHWWTYWWVSQLGMLPGTMAYVYAGSTVRLKELAEHGFQGVGWQTLLAFCILGVLPIAVKKLMGFIRWPKATSDA